MRHALVMRLGALVAVSGAVACQELLDFDGGPPPRVVVVGGGGADASAASVDSAAPTVETRDAAVAAPIAPSASGALDVTFADDGVLEIEESSASSVIVAPDGRLVVAGALAFGGGLVVRLTPTGDFDDTFAFEGIFKSGETSFTCGAYASDGTLLLGGRMQYGSSLVAGISRLTPSGQIDLTFGSGGAAVGSGETVTGLLLESAGAFIATTDKADVLQTSRFAATGLVDATFAEPPQTLVGMGSAGPITSGADGSVLVGGHDDRGILAVTFAGGIVTETVLLGTSLSGVRVTGIMRDSTGRVVLSATGLSTASEQRATVVRLLSTGALDPRFADGGVFEAPGALDAGAVLDAQGRLLLLIGDRITRLTPSGTIDTTFGNGGSVTLAGSTSHPVRGRALTLQPDGRIVAAGYVATLPATMFVARVMP